MRPFIAPNRGKMKPVADHLHQLESDQNRARLLAENFMSRWGFGQSGAAGTFQCCLGADWCPNNQQRGKPNHYQGEPSATFSVFDESSG